MGVEKVGKNHYKAFSITDSDSSPVEIHSNLSRNSRFSNSPNRNFYKDDHRPSSRNPDNDSYLSFTNGRKRDKSRDRSRDRSRSRDRRRRDQINESGSDIYITSAAYKTPSEMSYNSRHSRQYMASPTSYKSNQAPPSDIASTVRTKNSRKAGAVVETMAAPNPFCPNIRGMCCLMVLINLGLILVCLGFMIVLQFTDFVVWILGLVFLIFGLLTLIGSLIYCVIIFREHNQYRDGEDFYWTHYWRKNIGLPEINYKSADKSVIDSDRYSVDKQSSHYRY